MSRLRKQLPIIVALIATPVLTLLVAPDAVDPGAINPWWYSGDPVIAAAQRKTFAVRDSIRAFEATWERLDSREKATGLTARGTGLEIRVDNDVPAVTAAAFTRRARTELTALTSAPAYPVVLRLTTDPFTRALYRRVAMLPERAGAPCIAMIRINGTRVDSAAPNHEDQLLGVCGLYAKFGAPGAGMEGWLERTQLRSAAAHTGSAVPPKRRAEVTSQIVKEAVVPVGCLAGKDDACDRFFDGDFFYGAPATDPETSRQVEPTNVPRLAVYSSWAAGSDFLNSLPTLRAALGDEQFAAIWRSASEPAEAYALNEGSSLASWTRARLAAEVEPYHAGPMVGGMQLSLAFLIVVAFCGLVARFSKRQFRG